MQTEIFGLTLDNIVIFVLTTFRIGGLFVAAPILGHAYVPAQVKVVMVLALGYCLFPYVGGQNIEIGASSLSLLMFAVREFAFGVVIGFLFQMIFIGVEFGGGLIGYQIGYALANVVDPTTSANVPLIGQFKLMLATLIFMVINGHHVMIQALFESFKLVPLGAIDFTTVAMNHLLRFSGSVFAIGIKIAAPVLVTLFLTDVALGIIARTMPQMNILIIGFQVKIGVGLLVLAISLPMFNYVFTQLFNRMSLDALAITKGFAG